MKILNDVSYTVKLTRTEMEIIAAMSGSVLGRANEFPLRAVADGIYNACIAAGINPEAVRVRDIDRTGNASFFLIPNEDHLT